MNKLLAKFTMWLYFLRHPGYKEIYQNHRKVFGEGNNKYLIGFGALSDDRYGNKLSNKLVSDVYTYEVPKDLLSMCEPADEEVVPHPDPSDAIIFELKKTKPERAISGTTGGYPRPRVRRRRKSSAV